VSNTFKWKRGPWPKKKRRTTNRFQKNSIDFVGGWKGWRSISEAGCTGGYPQFDTEPRGEGSSLKFHLVEIEGWGGGGFYP